MSQHADARRYALLLSAAMLAVVAFTLWLKPEWWRGDQDRPEFSIYLRVEEPRESLLGVFHSYDNEQQITQQLAGQRWTVERVHVEGTDSYPPYKIDTLTVPGYRHLDYPGTLSLEFFNDRLSSAAFRPDEPRLYSKRLRETGVNFQRQSLSIWQQQSGNLRISTNHVYATSDVGRTLGTPVFFSWEDTRLTAQSRQWYDVYGSKTMVAPVRTQSSDSTQ
ncbi:MAG: hypothetical protein ACRES4_00205 [Nevskiales bacterium]